MNFNLGRTGRLLLTGLLGGLCLLTPPAAKAARADEETDLLAFQLDRFLLQTLPGGYFFANVFENLAPDTTQLIEESNAFSLIDNPRVYFEGDSISQFNWYMDGFDINSALDQGAPALQLPFSAIDTFRLESETPVSSRYGFSFNPEPGGDDHTQITFSNLFGNLGGYSALGPVAINPHASERGDDLYSSRRKNLANFFADANWSKSGAKSALQLALTYFTIDRQFNDFNLRDQVFEEEGEMLMLYSRWRHGLANRYWQLEAAFNRTVRQNLFAELGRYPQETYSQGKNSFFAGLLGQWRDASLRISLLHEAEDRRPQTADFSKDLIDNDGEGLWPFERWGQFSATTIRLALDRPFRFTVFRRPASLETFARGSLTLLNGDEGAGSANTFSYGGQPYQVVLWQPGVAYRNQRYGLLAGVIVKTELLRNLSVIGKFFLHYQGLSFAASANRTAFLTPGVDLGVLWNERHNPEILVAYGRTPYELGSDVNFFLEQQRPEGALYRWQDVNGDLDYDQGETGTFLGRSGGPSHGLADDFRIPTKERLLLLLTTRLTGRFRLQIKGIYKRVHNQPWVYHAGDYGDYETVAGRDYFFFNQPVNAFELANSRFDRDPFYAQLQLRVFARKEQRWYFSFSFMAHIGMGNTAFGNGAGANDIGIIAESQANPNSWINGFGRVDGDRAFVGRVFFGCYLSKGLFLSGTVKYRDGDPFAFLNAFWHHDQLVITYQTIKAEDDQGVKGGPREDCVWDFNLRLGYGFNWRRKKIEVELSLFNLLDFGSELSENVYSGGWRNANELQLARSLRLGVTIGL